MSRPLRQSGVALIIVLLVVAIVSVLATQMGGRLQLQIRRSANIKDNNQAYWYAMGAEQFARKSIEALYKEADGVIHLNQPWATTDFEYPLPNGGIQAKLVDMQSCFNLNALATPPPAGSNGGASAGYTEQKAFQTLLTSIESETEIPPLNAETLADSLTDWLDADNQTTGYYGAEDPEYESRQHPYLAANSLMMNKSELRLVNGAETPWINDVMPYVCAIPGVSTLKINVNTVTEEHAAVLRAALGSAISLEDVISALNARGDEGFDNINKFFSQAEISKVSLTDAQKKWFDITTSYFILHTKTRYNDASFNLSSVFAIDSNGNVSVIRREFGGLL
ncbi:type II secretion system minor pseudopilin GspK [Neptunicella sp. SCSIO 80796]|uniref:type II secretion system minor pseudopilin GspK n=1 Tax=Neptunicella plasticusilytica TaxID=3117012 RepID=UPI003A4D2429